MNINRTDQVHKYLLIGAGASNIYSALYMLEQDIDGEDICIIDKGKSVFIRDGKDLLHGMGGAGAFSDAKHVFSEQPDLNIIKYLGIDNVKDYYKFIQSQLVKFHPEPEKIDVTFPTVFDEKVVEGWGDVAMAQSITWHVGSHYGVELIKNIEYYLISKGVTIQFETEVSNIFPLENKVKTTHDVVYYYDKLIIATGRSGSKFINKLLTENNINLKKQHLDIGVRFETPYTTDIKLIVEKQYDFKFRKHLDKYDARTFCVCNNSAYVSEEYKEGKFMGWNGEGFGINHIEKMNGLTNFGILINVQDEDADNIMNIARQHKYIINGPDYKYPSSISELNDATEISLDDFNKLQLPVTSEINEFISYLEPILKFGGNYRMFYPEIKESSGSIKSSLKWQITELPDIYLVGDSTPLLYDGGTRGIIPAAVSGIDCVNSIINRSTCV